MISRLEDTGGIIREITPDDAAYVHNCKALYSNAGATLSLQWRSEAPVEVILPAGTLVPVISPFRVRATGTTGEVLGFFGTDY